jgi:hypothetical protein
MGFLEGCFIEGFLTIPILPINPDSCHSSHANPLSLPSRSSALYELVNLVSEPSYWPIFTASLDSSTLPRAEGYKDGPVSILRRMSVIGIFHQSPVPD